jgi:predicted P-loop ATPase
MLNEIKALVDCGFSVLWLKPKSKAPIGNGWTKESKKTYTELEKEYKKNYNVGVRLGEPSRLHDGSYLAVIDCDIKSENYAHKNEFMQAIEGLPFDWTLAPRVMSGRGNGSFHLYIKTPEPLKSFRYKSSQHRDKVLMPSTQPTKRDFEALSTDEIEQGYRMRNAWEIDFVGTGKQVVLPPSIHPDSGLEYKWHGVFDVKNLTLLNPENFSAELLKADVKPTKRFQYVPTEIDLLSSALKPAMLELIISGTGVEKYDGDSEALFAAVMAMLGCGFNDHEVISVLSDTSFYLGQVAGRHTVSDNPEKWAKWIYKYNIVKARTIINKDRGFDTEAIEEKLEDGKAAEQIRQIKDTENWKTKLNITDSGHVKPTVWNVNLILSNVLSGPIFALNDFTKDQIYVQVPPWEKPNRHYIGNQITDDDISSIIVWLSTHYRCEASRSTIETVISSLTQSNSRHPVQNYLKGLEWDGIERLDHWLQMYLGCTGDTRYLQAVGRKTLVAAVARIFRPGTKFDQVLILEGPQGAGKSTVIQHLASTEWFTDQLGDITNKDSLDKMRGIWIVELGELASFTRHEVERLKEFISAQTDKFRPPYGRRTQDFPRQCIFIGSTNNYDYLKDTTGNRRYWPVKVGKIDMNAVKEDRDQLWAEAYQAFLAGEKLYFDDIELIKTTVNEQTKRQSIDDFTADLWEKIQTWADGIDHDLNRISTFSLYNEILNTSLISGQGERSFKLTVSHSMRILGYVLDQKRVTRNHVTSTLQTSKSLVTRAYLKKAKNAFEV